MPPCGLDVAAVTAGQPFCAGVIAMVAGRLVVTLARDHAPGDGFIRVGGVGGGQEPGETVVECALREAREELGVDVELVSSPRTYIDDLDGHVRAARCTDPMRPLVFWSTPRPDPRPHGPGLPEGPTLYGAMYLARLDREPEPGDVDALLLTTASEASWRLVEQGTTLGEALDADCRLIERAPLARDLRLWAPGEEAMRTVFELAGREPGLLAPLR
jgi:8-oxo-dGTP pyrophosphatase MutT (NUDIX family)